MGRVITSVVGQTRPGLLRLIRVVIPIALVFSILTILVNVYLFIALMMTLFATAIIAAIVIGLLYRVTITITEDELIVKSREGVITIPRSIVTSSNILCIKERSEISWRSGFYIRTAQVYKLRMSYGPVNYTIQLYEWGYDRLVNSLREYWGWTPPECPRT